MASGGKVIVKIDGDTKNFKEKFNKLKGYAGKAAKGIAVGFTAAAGAVTAIGTAAVKAYGDYEQLVGGIETLFGTGGQTLEEYAASTKKTTQQAAKDYEKLTAVQEKMLHNAHSAFERAGMSANTYMETATSFAASLVASLGGDTDKAADYADRAMVDMSDNANKMGTNLEMIQNAYQGFAKQNYTMLDNLKLGYGGTQEEMKRLIKDASKMKDVQKELGVTVDASSMSFGNIVNAISVMQKSMGIAGTTAKEATTTIQGSLNMTKAAWENLMIALANPDGNVGEAMDDLIFAAEKVGENMLPIIQNVLNKIPEMISGLGSTIVSKLPEVVNTILPQLAASAMQLLTVFADTVSGNSDSMADAAAEIVTNLATGIIRQAPKILNAGVSILSGFVDGLNRELPALMAFAKSAATAFAFLKIGTAVAAAQKALTAYTKTLTAAKITQAAFSSDAIYKKVLNGKLAYSALEKSAKSMALAQAAVNGQITVGQTLVGVLTGKITLATLATALWTKAQEALNFVKSLDPTYLLITATAALCVGIYAACKAYDSYIEKNNALVIETREIAEASQETEDKVSELSSTLQDLSDNAASRIESAEAEAYANKALADELYNLAGQTELTNTEKERMKDIVDQLNGSVDGLNLKFDEEKGTLNLTRDAVEELITKKLELAKANAVSEMYTDILKNQYKAQKDALGAAQKLADAQEKLAELDKKAAENPSYKLTKEYKKSYDNLTDAVSNYEDAIVKSHQAVDNSFTDMQNLAAVTGVQLPESLDEAKDKMNGFFDGVTDALGIANEGAINNANWFVQGYIGTILSKKNMTAGYNATYAWAQNLLRGAADGQKSHSPSKETQKLGRYFGEGYVLGINDTTPEVEKTAANMAEAAVGTVKRVLSKSELSAQITGIVKDTRTEVQKVIDENNKELLDSEKKYNDESLRIQKKKSKSKYEQLVLDAKAEYTQELKKATTSEQIAEACAKYKERLQKAANKATKEEQERADEDYLDGLKEAADAERKLYDALQKDIENRKNSIISTFNELAEAAIDSIDEVAKAQETFAKKLKDWGNLYTTDTYEIGGVKYSVARLADLEKQSEKMEDYTETLLQLKARGDIPAEFFNILKEEMSLDESLMFAKGLLAASDEEFTKYINSWKKIQTSADTEAKFLYADETQKANEEISKKFDDFNSDIEQKGKDNAAAWGEGFFEKIREVMPEIRSRIEESLKSIAPYSGFIPSMAGGNVTNISNTYNLPGGEGQTNTDLLAKLKNFETLQKARGGY